MSIHVFADMLWIGSIVAVGALISAKATMALSARGTAARWIYLRLASPAFIIAFITGLACIAADPSHSLMKIPSMHVKLTLALGVIGLHHWLGSTSRRIAAGTREVPVSPIPVALLVLAAGAAAVLGVLKPF